MINFKLYYEALTHQRMREYGKFRDKVPVRHWDGTEGWGLGAQKYDPSEYKKRRDEKIHGFKPTGDDEGVVSGIRRINSETLEDIMYHYGFLGLSKLSKDGSLVYRGHKHLDPFSKGDDAKAKGEAVYFAADPKYAYSVYSIGYNSGSRQIGQSGFSSLQSAFSDPNDAARTHSFKVGFFTIATPKNPDEIKWYSDFGYEDGKEGKTRDEFPDFENPGNPEHGWHVHLECVEPRSSFSRIRTYLSYERARFGAYDNKGYDTSFISFEKLKKVSPDMYSRLMNSRIIKNRFDPRVI